MALIDGSKRLGDLSDVNVTGVQSNDVLVFNGVDWVPGEVAMDSGVSGYSGYSGSGISGYSGSSGRSGYSGYSGTSLNFRAAWPGFGNYLVNDVVTNHGSSYICIVGHIPDASNEPGVGVDTGTYWAVLCNQERAAIRATAEQADDQGTAASLVTQDILDILDILDIVVGLVAMVATVLLSSGITLTLEAIQERAEINRDYTDWNGTANLSISYTDALATDISEWVRALDAGNVTPRGSIRIFCATLQITGSFLMSLV